MVMEQIRVTYLDDGCITHVDIPDDEEMDLWELLGHHVPDLYDRLTDDDILGVEVL